MNLNKIISTTLVVLALGVNCVNGQNTKVNGVITNSENGKAVEFANIGIEDTYLGTATDVEGHFELMLSEQIADKLIRISAVGFKPKTYSVSNWLRLEEVKVQLTPVNYGISEVNIEAKSKIGYGILRSASNLISDNYMQNPYTYRCYMLLKSSTGEVESQSESIVLLSDKLGYTDRSFTGAFKNRNYIVKEFKGQVGNSLKSGLTYIDQIINQDLVRCPGNILSTESINDFDVELIGEDIYNKDSVWVISYVCDKPTIQNSGDPELTSYEGKIWIKKSDNAILKNSIEAVRDGNFIHGNSFINVNSNSPEINYKAECTYILKDEKYVLNSINYQLSNSKDKIQQKLFFKVVDVAPYNEKIVNRQYYNSTAMDSIFWHNFKSPQFQ